MRRLSLNLIRRFGWWNIYGLCAVVCLIVTNGAHAAEAGRAKRVLIISAGSRLATGFIVVDQQLLQALVNIPSVPIETYAENLDLIRFSSERYQQIFTEYLTAKYAMHPPDLVILVFVGNLGIPGTSLLRLFPATPIVVAGLTEEELRADQFGPFVTGLAQRVNPRANLEVILRLQPELRRVVVIGGTTEIDSQVTQRVRDAAQSFQDRIAIEFWDKLTMPELRQAVTALPRDTAILFARMFRDAANQAFISSQVAQTLAESANAPVYVMTDANLGTGAVGGAVASIEAFGKRAGELARLILTGTDVKTLPLEIRTDSIPTFNWPALQRWGIDEARLPPNSVVRNRPESLWRQYRWYASAALLVICLQSAMIGDLFLQRRRLHRTQAVLRESQQLMELATNAGELGLWSRDLTDGDFWANESMRSLFGFGVEDPLRFEDVLARIHADDRSRMLSGLERAQTAGLPFEGEFRILLPDGAERWVAAKGRTVADPGGSGDERRMGVVTEITERKKAEKALRESENLLTEAQSIAHLGGWQWDMLTGRNIWSAENYRLFGYEPGAVEPRYDVWFDRIHPDDRSRVLDHLQAVFAGRTSYDIEYRVIHPNGETRHVHCLGEVSRDATGAPERMAGTVLDITERKRTEEKFQSAVEASPNAIVMIDDQGRILLVNTQGEKLFGYARAELIGQSVEMLVPERFRAGHPAHRGAFFDSPQARAMGTGRDLFARRKDGSEFLVEIKLNPIQTAEGLLVLTAIVDITERKRIELEVQRNREELAHVTRVATVGELTTSIAHELNQPLGAILSNAEAAEMFLMAEPPALDEVREILADIRKDDQRASEVIRRVRSLLRKQELTPKSIEINDAVEEVLKLVSIDASHRKVALKFERAADLPRAWCDPVHLQQVVLNLVLNGMEAMAGLPEEKRQVVVRTGLGDDGTVKIAVADCGPGIPVDRLPKLFEPFFTTKKDGMGMGLSIARTIVEAHRGKIWAENNPARGATFYFTMPVDGGK